MPSVKQGGGYTLTFAKKNEDVKELLAEKKQIKGLILTDYVCEAIRFFESNKNKINATIDSCTIEELVKKEIAKALNNVDNKSTKELSTDLEENLDETDIDED
ncbi:MAG: hypothetical protein RR712_03440 [Terrisporobacter sp.]